MNRAEKMSAHSMIDLGEWSERVVDTAEGDTAEDEVQELGVGGEKEGEGGGGSIWLVLYNKR